jgi:hypothetical protein
MLQFMRHFCTYFDHNYLPKGLTLYTSLREHCGDSFRLWVLCLSRECYTALKDLNYPHLHPVPLEDLEKSDQELLRIKSTRTIIEYYFTCTPCFPLFLLRQNPDIDLITYLDSDLFFFHSPEPVFQEIGTSSIAIIPHRFSPERQILERYGIYNVGWLSFRNDTPGLNCLEWYRSRCLEWCFDRYEDGKFADQKYLDHWPQQFPGVCVLQHKGANLALWNIINYAIQDTNQGLFVDEVPLIFYHFQGIRYHEESGYSVSISPHDVRPGSWDTVWEKIYVAYMQALHNATARLSHYLPASALWGSVRGPADMSWLQDPTQNPAVAPIAPPPAPPLPSDPSSVPPMSSDLISAVTPRIVQALQQSPTPLQDSQSDAFLRRLVASVQHFCQDPEDAVMIGVLRVLRHQLIEAIASISLPDLPNLYRDRLGAAYRPLLQSGFNQQPLLPAEEPIVAQLGQTIAQGLDKPGGVQALMGAMLYYPPGKMQVRDAATRIPGWLLPDYQAVFEPGAAVAPAGDAPATPATSPALVAPPTAAGGSLETDMVFLNRLLGCANLYYIDPEEVSIAEETRQLRRQVADYWLTVGGDRLEAVYRAEFGQRYRALLTCGIQNAPLTAEEEAFAQQLSARVAQGLEQPAGVAAFLGVMLFYPPGKMQVRDAQNRLPAWLWPDYQAVFELPRDPETPPLQPSAPPVTATPSVAAPTPVVPTPVVPTLAAPTPAAPPTAQPVVSIDQAYLDRLLVHVQAYQANPQDAGAIAELRSMRRQLAYVWIGVPTGELETVYGGMLGDRYRALLRSGIQNVPLIDDEPGFVQQLATQIGYGFEHPEAVKALLGAMLFYAPGQMQVRDAATRLPAWLVPDYQAVFAAPAASPAVPAAAATITTTPIAPTPTSPTVPTSPPASPPVPAALDPRFEDLVFLNRLLGCTNLYEIDPTDAETIADLRDMRRQTTELWQGLAGDRLEAVYTSEFGRRYRALLSSGFQKEPLDDAERQTLQGLAREIAARLEEPAGVKALLAAMAYYAPGTMQVRDAATRLPVWLLEDYRQIFEPAECTLNTP